MSVVSYREVMTDVFHALKLLRLALVNKNIQGVAESRWDMINFFRV